MNRPISLSNKCSKNLPKNGWIKACLHCSEPTSRVFKYFYKHSIYDCYFCKHCVCVPADILSVYMQKIIKMNIHLIIL